MPTRQEMADRKLRNRIAHAVASREMIAVHKGHALAKYMPELGDAIHDDEVNIGVLRKRRGSLTDEQCIARVTDLLSYGVGERKACRVVGVVWREWNDWKRANLHNLKQQEALARLIRINAMQDEIMEIVDDHDLRKPDTKQVNHTREDGSEYETTEVVLTPREKLAIAQARIEARKWSLEKLAPAFTPQQLKTITNISTEVELRNLTPQQAMDRYRDMLMIEGQIVR
jgi:hypothetical protein